MGERAEKYRAELGRLKRWQPYLNKHSGLPGPRANLELVRAVGDEADSRLLWRFAASDDEFLALCGAAGLGRLAVTDPDRVMARLRELASDSRWRVREGVAMALQRIGRQDMAWLLGEMKAWAGGEPLVQRAAAAGLCEPALLSNPGDVKQVAALLDRITASIEAAPERREDDFRVLRQALGYCWSVAAAAAPEDVVGYMERWLRSSDPDVRWIMKQNLAKARMARVRSLLSG
ncbi:MAG: HEAT repeat domain-containing protein [Candidatus Dormibacterales bacterium]